jgi:monofunctional biosynthetic peptidoglycan transglycosylase
MTVSLSAPLPQASWVVVNDTVMGGVSSSQVRVDSEGAVLFEGDLSLENNGGFTSTRAMLGGANWSGVEAIRIRVAGDGRSYLATARVAGTGMRRLYYRMEVPTVAGEITDVVLPLDSFDCYAYGTRVPGAPSLREVAYRMDSVGFMLADKQPGAFALRILEMEPVRLASGQPDMVPPPGNVNTVFALAIEQGAPLYNNGQPERCADVYMTAVQSALMLGADGLSENDRVRLAQAIREASRESDPSTRAWLLRYAMDAVMAPSL